MSVTGTTKNLEALSVILTAELDAGVGLSGGGVAERLQSVGGST